MKNIPKTVNRSPYVPSLMLLRKEKREKRNIFQFAFKVAVLSPISLLTGLFHKVYWNNQKKVHSDD
jgi:hypothetical protein